MVGAFMTQISGAKTFTQAMGMENAIIGHGVMRMGDLNSALITGILPSAKVAGLGLLDVGAALDTRPRAPSPPTAPPPACA